MSDLDFNRNEDQPKRSIIELFLDGVALYAPDGTEISEEDRRAEFPEFARIVIMRARGDAYFGRIIQINDKLLDDAPNQIIDCGVTAGERTQLRVRLDDAGFETAADALKAGRADVLRFERWKA